MITQPYVFTGNDPLEVYQRVRRFCARLHEAGINPESLECVRGNTKYYPDAGMNSTTVEVFPGIAVSEQFDVAEQIYAEAINLPLDAQYGRVVKAFQVLKPFPQFSLEVYQDGFSLLEDTGNGYDTHFQDVREWQLEEQVRRVLIARGLIVAEESKASSNDFDPFLDSDDLS